MRLKQEYFGICGVRINCIWWVKFTYKKETTFRIDFLHKVLIKMIYNVSVQKKTISKSFTGAKIPQKLNFAYKNCLSLPARHYLNCALRKTFQAKPNIKLCTV